MVTRSNEKVNEMEDALASSYESTAQTKNALPEEEPLDRYHIVKATMYLFGITSLLPWNFFIQANDYWMYRFRNVSVPFDPSAEEKTGLQAVFSSYLAIASKVPYVCFLLVNAYVSARYHIVKATMYLFGITSLLPWNFFIQANDYWMYRFRNVSVPFDPSAEEKTGLQAVFSSYLAIASKVPYVCFLLVNAYVSARLPPTRRIQWPLMAMIILFAITTAIVFVDTDSNQPAFFAVTIAIVVAINAMCGFVQGGATGVAGCLPRRFMQYNVNGYAVGSLVASVAQILSLVSITDPADSAFFFFATATTFLCITFVMCRLTMKSALYNFYMSKQTSMSKKHRLTDGGPRRASNLEIFKEIWVYALSIVFVFWATISILPAVVVLVLSTSTEKTIWTGRLFLPVACFLLFNVSDLASRLVAHRIAIPARFKYLTLSLTMLRFVFLPLMMLCNAHPRKHLPVVFESDADFIIITVFFAFTGGYLCTIVLTQGPKVVKEEHMEQAGSQLAFFLGVGLMLGSISSFGLVKFL